MSMSGPNFVEPAASSASSAARSVPGRAIFVPSCSVTRAFATDHEYGVLWASATAADAASAPGAKRAP